MHSILIHNGAILPMNAQNAFFQNGWLLVEGDKIADIGEGNAPERLLSQAHQLIDATHMVVLPGLINAHTHLSQTFMRGLGDDKPLIRWLKEAVWPLQAAFTAEDMRLASLLGLVENVRSGVTSVNQHHKLPAAEMSDAALHAARQVGVRFQLARGWVDLGDAYEKPDGILGEMKRLVADWHRGGDSRLKVSFGPMAPWRCSDESMGKFVALARAWDVPTHIHIAETRDEIDMLSVRTGGLRHVEWLESLGLLGEDLQLVHCVHISEDEQTLLADRGAVVVHCPTSNMYLASGIAPIPDLLEKGVAIALGTDGAASHNSQDLLETLKMGILLAKIGFGSPTAMTTLQALQMATIAGAKIMRRDDIGQLKAGFQADISIIDLNKAHVMPWHRVESSIVYNCNAADVDTVIVAGNILLQNGILTMLDEGALIEECRLAARRITQRAGMIG